MLVDQALATFCSDLFSRMVTSRIVLKPDDHPELTESIWFLVQYEGFDQ
jgi:hypothetical protein